jgi:tRNA (cmo5U34)-methyltransferase
MTSNIEELPGHHWKEQDRVDEYISRTDEQQEDRDPVFALMCRLIPKLKDDNVKILDIGSGHGPVITAVLDHFPKSTGIGLDISEAMMAVGTERMARFGDRFGYVTGDFSQGELPKEVIDAGPYDVVVSARAIHHLAGDEMSLLYKTIYDNLSVGGSFFNMDEASAPNQYLDDLFRAIRRGGEAVPQGNTMAAGRGGHSFKATVAEHFEYLEKAGFQSVECFWKRLNIALLGGYKQ